MSAIKCKTCGDPLKKHEAEQGFCFTCQELEDNRRRRLHNDPSQHAPEQQKQSKHTPGTWKVDGGEGVMDLEIRHIDGRSIAVITGYRGTVDENAANANLIAAAPELLAALIACREDVATPISDNPWAVKQRKAHQMADAAIAKAKGEQR